MKAQTRRCGFRLASQLIVAAMTATGCASYQKDVIRDVDGRTYEICRKCHEAAEQFLRDGKPKDASFGADQAVFKQVCAECGTDMDIHQEGKVWVLRCTRCSVAGIAFAPVGAHEIESPHGR